MRAGRRDPDRGLWQALALEAVLGLQGEQTESAASVLLQIVGESLQAFTVAGEAGFYGNLSGAPAMSAQSIAGKEQQALRVHGLSDPDSGDDVVDRPERGEHHPAQDQADHQGQNRFDQRLQAFDGLADVAGVEIADVQ